jgi:phosphoenolpyruvate carboxykinase (GTP)
MAMLPFCGYHMADYFAHWLRLGETEGAQMPKVFYVNWFRKNDKGKWLWPGFGENSRVLEWVFRRCDGDAEAVGTPIGLLPTPEALNLEGLGISEQNLQELLKVDAAEWRGQLPQFKVHLASFGDKLPRALREELDALTERLAQQD